MYNDEEIKKLLGKNIRLERKNSSLSQEQLAEKINVSQKFISDIESCKKLGSITTILNICTVLNITPNQIFRDLLTTNLEEEQLFNKITTLNEHDKNIIIAILKEM